MLLSKYNNWNGSEKLQGEVEKVKENYHSIFVKLKVTGEGIIHIYWSDFKSKPLNEWENFGDSWNFETNDLSFKGLIKGKYFYIKFTDTENLTALDVKTYFATSDMIENKGTLTAASSVLCMAENPALKQVPLKVDADGKLITTGSGGGGGGGDASAANQLIEIGELQELNSKTHISNLNLEAIHEDLASDLIKCDTDNVIIDSTNPVQVVNLAKVENTLNNAFLVVDSAQNLKVTVANQNDLSTLAKEETLTQIKTELINNMPTKENQVEIGETVQTIEDLMLNVDYTQGYADIYTDAVTLGADSNPSFTTHPTLDGWYYQNTALNGASNLYFYANAGGQQKQHKVSELYSSYVVCNLLNISNSANTPFLVVYSKPTGTNDYAPWYHSKWIYKIPNASIIAAGQSFLMFQGELPNQQIFSHMPRVEAILVETFGEGNKANETLLYCTVNTDSGASQNTTKVVYTGVGYNLMGRNSIITLGVGKQQQTRDIKDKIDNLSSIVGAGVFVQLDSNVNGLKLKSTLNDGSADVNVVNDIDVNNLTKCDTDNVIIQSGSVNSHIVDVVNAPLTFTNVGLKNCGDVVINNNSLDVHCFGSSDGSTFHHLKTNPNGVLSTNAIIETNNGTLTSTIDDDVNALDVSVKNVVNANMRTSVNGLLTSTSVSGTEVYNALDVKCKGITDISGNVNLKTADNGQLTSTLSGSGNSIHALDVKVQNTTPIEIKVKQFGSYLNLCNNETVNPYSAGATVLDVEEWAYFTGYYTDIQGGFANWPETRRLQFSFDGTTWTNLFNVSISPSNVNGVNVASIYQQNIPAVKYMRFYNDTNLTLASVNCTIVGATAQ